MSHHTQLFIYFKAEIFQHIVNIFPASVLNNVLKVMRLDFKLLVSIHIFLMDLNVFIKQRNGSKFTFLKTSQKDTISFISVFP